MQERQRADGWEERDEREETEERDPVDSGEQMEMKCFRWVYVVLLCLNGSGVLAGTQFSEAIAAAPAIASSSRTTAITENQIRQILNQILAATKRWDMEEIANILAPKARIIMTFRSAERTETLRLNREQYLAYTRQGMSLIQDYDARMTNLKIQVAANRKSATATYILVEQTSVMLNNQSIPVAASSNTQVKFELLGGRVLATSIATTTTMTPQQSL